MKPGAAHLFLVAVFLAMVGMPMLVQTVRETSRGERPQALDVLLRAPTPANLRAYERALENASVTMRTLRPYMQAAQFLALRNAGEKALVGREGWYFYGPGVGFLTQRPKPGESTPDQALSAVIRFRNQLAERDIRLILVPAPNKESVYPERLTRFAKPSDRIVSAETREFLEKLKLSGIEVVDLFALFREARRRSSDEVCLAQDSHWSPAGMELAARSVADRILAHGWLKPGVTAYRREPVPVKRLGDIVRMIRSPQIEQSISPEKMTCQRIVRGDTGDAYRDDPGAEVLVLGDSFLRIYQQDEPGQAGFVAHLAHALGRPIASIVNDGGAATLVRQDLFRRPHLLDHAKVLVWEFVERDLRFATEGWQNVPLPPVSTPGASSVPASSVRPDPSSG